MKVKVRQPQTNPMFHLPLAHPPYLCSLCSLFLSAGKLFLPLPPPPSAPFSFVGGWMTPLSTRTSSEDEITFQSILLISPFVFLFPYPSLSSITLRSLPAFCATLTFQTNRKEFNYKPPFNTSAALRQINVHEYCIKHLSKSFFLPSPSLAASSHFSIQRLQVRITSVSAKCQKNIWVAAKALRRRLDGWSGSALWCEQML